jgi:hypothetical protein
MSFQFGGSQFVWQNTKWLAICTTALNRKKLPILLDLRASVCMFWGEVAEPQLELFFVFLGEKQTCCAGI